MKCVFCKCDVRGVDVFDTSSSGNIKDEDIAWNLYCCDSCGAIARENVWDYPGTVWIGPDNAIVYDFGFNTSKTLNIALTEEKQDAPT